MALSINTNTAALMAQANLAQSSQRVSMSFSRLSSSRINIDTGDDAMAAADLMRQRLDAAQAASGEVASELKPQGQEAKDTVTLTQRNTRESAAVEQKQIDATQAVKSRQDADWANEVAQFTRIQMRQQPGTSVLAQSAAASLPGSALALLR